jgi:hypothetical protein
MAEPTGQQLFRERREQCTAPTSEIIDFLMAAAANAGPDIKTPIYEAGGNGPKYSNQGGQFCALHLRTTTPHVWAKIFGSHRESLVSDGFEPSEQDDWFKVKTMQEAVRFVKWLMKAHHDRT